MARNRGGFTLIELLIVVAIIAILAAIAVPNFLEAQVRVKVSRCRADQRSIEIGLESYRIDTNTYPPTGSGQMRLTTPVGYLSSLPEDPFQPMAKDSNNYKAHSNAYGPDSRYYMYHGPPTYSNNNVANKYNIRWTLQGVGPDRRAGTVGQTMGEFPYDSTNGTVSSGNIERIGPGNIPEIRYREIWNYDLWR